MERKKVEILIQISPNDSLCISTCKKLLKWLIAQFFSPLLTGLNCIKILLSLLCVLLCSPRPGAYKNSFCIKCNHNSPGPNTFSECLFPDPLTPTSPLGEYPPRGGRWLPQGLSFCALICPSLDFLLLVNSCLHSIHFFY